MGENDTKVFQVVLDRPMPEGVKISRFNTCQIEIVSDDDAIVEAKKEATDIEFDIRQVNFDHLRRKHAFFAGVNI